MFPFVSSSPIRLFIIAVALLPIRCAGQSDGKGKSFHERSSSETLELDLGADARSTEVGIGCFSADSLVQLIDGREKSIGSLQLGDTIITAQQSKLTSTEMILMLDKKTSEEGIARSIHV
jgi:Hint module